MKLNKVESSNIIAIGWEKDVLQVVYASGVYNYNGVKESVFNDLMEAESKGKFMNNNIKPYYTYERVLA